MVSLFRGLEGIILKDQEEAVGKQHGGGPTGTGTKGGDLYLAC